MEGARDRGGGMSKLKAYTVQEEDEGTGGIVFARSSAEARRRGSSEFGDGDFNWGSARRARWADPYAEAGAVPWRVMFAHGWWCECHGCGGMIREDEEDPETGKPIEYDITEVGSTVYCRPACRELRIANDAEVARITEWVIGDLTDRLLKALPGAVLCGQRHVYVPAGEWPLYPKEAVLGFTFPGAIYGGGTIEFRKINERPRFRVLFGDRAAFFAWQRAGYPPHMMDAAA